MDGVLRRQFLIAAMALLAAPLTADARQTTKQYRIGYLTTGSPANSPHLYAALIQGLRELGWVEGKNIAIEHRWAEGKFELLPGLAADLVRLGVDVIVVTTTQSALAAKNATRTLPIVTVVIGDPIATGLVTSLARPDGNITGLTFVARDGRKAAGVTQAKRAPSVADSGSMEPHQPNASPLVARRGECGAEIGGTT